MKLNSSCDGCRVNFEFLACWFKKYDSIEECPCGECLIKMMCLNPCSEHSEKSAILRVRRIEEQRGTIKYDTR